MGDGRETVNGMNSGEPRQIGLFEQDGGRMASHVAGLMTAVRACMAQAAARSQLSRAQILDRINAIILAAGVRLTKGNAKAISGDTLDKWLNPGEREHAPSLLAVNVFCLAVGDASAVAAMLHLHGMEPMTTEDRKFRDYGRAMAHQRKVRKALRKIEEDLQ